MELSIIDNQLLYRIMAIPTCSGHETMMTEFILNFAKGNDLEVNVDTYGNVYVRKGVLPIGDYYPCVTAHLDTVHNNQVAWINEHKLLDVVTEEENGRHKLYCVGTGIGADDKAGIVICLTLLLKLPFLKAVFCVEEECGCHGSERVDLLWFKDVGYIIGFDAPGWTASKVLGGIRLFSRNFYEKYLKEMESEFDLVDYRNHSYADALMLRMNTSLVCMNMCAGFYNYHTRDEYCIVEEMNKAAKLGIYLINKLGYKEYVEDIEKI